MDTTQIIALGGSIIGAVFASTGFWNWLTARSKKRTAADRLLIALAHDRIYYLCKKHLRDGEISHDDFDTLRHLAESYFENGGNGTAAEYVERIKELPFSD